MVVEAMINEGFSLHQRGESGHGELTQLLSQSSLNNLDNVRSVREEVSSLRGRVWRGQGAGDGAPPPVWSGNEHF